MKIKSHIGVITSSAVIVSVCVMFFYSNYHAKMNRHQEFREAVISALKKNDLKRLNAVLYGNQDIINSREWNIPLVVASRSVEQLKCFVENGADLSFVDEWGRTPIYQFCYRGNLRMVKYAIRNGAKLCLSAKGHTPMTSAAKKDNPLMIEYIAKNCPSLVNKATEFGDTPLHFSAEANLANNIATLLENGADASIQNDFGETPLHVALYFKSIEAAKILAKCEGSNLKAVDDAGNTPLDICLEKEYHDVISFFKESVQ